MPGVEQRLVAPYHSEKPVMSKATSIGSFAIAAGVREPAEEHWPRPGDNGFRLRKMAMVVSGSLERAVRDKTRTRIFRARIMPMSTSAPARPGGASHHRRRSRR